MKNKMAFAALMGLAGGAALVKFLESNPQASPTDTITFMNTGMNKEDSQELASSMFFDGQRRNLASFKLDANGIPMVAKSQQDGGDVEFGIKTDDDYGLDILFNEEGTLKLKHRMSGLETGEGGNKTVRFNENILVFSVLEGGDLVEQESAYNSVDNTWVLGSKMIVIEPTIEPTLAPIESTARPSLRPSSTPTHEITYHPTTGNPTLSPVVDPETGLPSKQPSHFIGGTTEAPTLIELDSSGKPTGKPTPIPTVEPSKDKPEIDIVPIVAGIGVITIVGGFLALRRCLGRNQPNRNWAGVVENQNPEQNVLHDVSNPMENLTGGSEVDPENPITRPRPVTLEGEAPPAPPARTLSSLEEKEDMPEPSRLTRAGSADPLVVQKSRAPSL